MPATLRIVTAAVVLLVVVGCGGDDPSGTDTVERDGRTVFVMEVPDCDDEHGCAMTIAIDGRLFAPGPCHDPVPEADLGDAVAVGDPALTLGYVEARAIGGTATDRAVALLGDGVCGPGSQTWIRATRFES